MPDGRAGLTMTSGRDHTPAEHEGAVMEDEWHALEHYLRTRTAPVREPAASDPPEPVVALPRVDPDDLPTPPPAALGAPPSS